jgi:hypothetical protein
MKPGREGDLPKLFEQLQATEQADSGLVGGRVPDPV